MCARACPLKIATNSDALFRLAELFQSELWSVQIDLVERDLKYALQDMINSYSLTMPQ